MTQDFASATMLRLLLRGMAARGLALPMALPDATARVALDDKRRVVRAAVQQLGFGGLLALARDIGQIAGEPLHQVLSAARDPQDFMQRWRRLERYIHASHRVQLLEEGPQHLTLKHEGPDPQPAESLAVLGVLIGSFEALGTHGLEVRIAGQQLHPQLDEGALRALVAGGALRQPWRLQWQRVSAPSAARRPLPPELCAGLPWPDTALALARQQLADPAAQRQLPAAAALLGLSGRSLQRLLAAHGLSYSGVVAEARARLAAWCLTRGADSLAEIGFLCGFADQAHFTREFTRRVGLPPARYRQAGAQ